VAKQGHPMLKALVDHMNLVATKQQDSILEEEINEVTHDLISKCFTYTKYDP